MSAPPKQQPWQKISWLCAANEKLKGIYCAKILIMGKYLKLYWKKIKLGFVIRLLTNKTSGIHVWLLLRFYQNIYLAKWVALKYCWENRGIINVLCNDFLCEMWRLSSKEPCGTLKTYKLFFQHQHLCPASKELKMAHTTCPNHNIITKALWDQLWWQMVTSLRLPSEFQGWTEIWTQVFPVQTQIFPIFYSLYNTSSPEFNEY